MNESEAPSLQPFVIDDASTHRTLRIEFDQDGTALLLVISGDGVDEVHKIGIEITVDDDLARLFEHVKPMLDYLKAEAEQERLEHEVQVAADERAFAFRAFAIRHTVSNYQRGHRSITLHLADCHVGITGLNSYVVALEQALHDVRVALQRKSGLTICKRCQPLGEYTANVPATFVYDTVGRSSMERRELERQIELGMTETQRKWIEART